MCPHVKGNISFVFSTGRDGRIKAWLYDSQVAAVVDYSAEGVIPLQPAIHCHHRMLPEMVLNRHIPANRYEGPKQLMNACREMQKKLIPHLD